MRGLMLFCLPLRLIMGRRRMWRKLRSRGWLIIRVSLLSWISRRKSLERHLVASGTMGASLIVGRALKSGKRIGQRGRRYALIPLRLPEEFLAWERSTLFVNRTNKVIAGISSPLWRIVELPLVTPLNSNPPGIVRGCLLEFMAIGVDRLRWSTGACRLRTRLVIPFLRYRHLRRAFHRKDVISLLVSFGNMFPTLARQLL